MLCALAPDADTCDIVANVKTSVTEFYYFLYIAYLLTNTNCLSSLCWSSFHARTMCVEKAE